MSDLHVLLDCSFLIYRSWYSLNEEKFKSPDGYSTNATCGFINTIKMLYNTLGVQYDNVYFHACFDSSVKNHERSVVQADYKINRPAVPDGLKYQFGYCRKVCKALKIPVYYDEKHEADDLIASLASKLSCEDNNTVVIVSVDKDMYQLINENVCMYNIQKKSYIKKEDVFSKLGVYPEDMVYYQALVGDKVDNISGIKGIGPKSACAIINYMKGNISIDKKVSKLLEKIESFKDTIEKNTKLVKLKQDINVIIVQNKFSRDLFKHQDWKEFATPLGIRA